MGFLGFGNYSKPGKGIKKEGQDKKRFFQFTEIFSRKFTKIILLSLLFSLFSLPGVIIGGVGVYASGILITSNEAFLIAATIFVIIGLGFVGPSISAMVKVARLYSMEKPVFLFSDFFDAYKQNFKQSVAMGLINSTLIYLIFQAVLFYFSKTVESWLYAIPLVLILTIALVAVLSNFYTHILIVTLDLKMFSIIRNAISLAFLGMKTNFFTLFFLGVIIVPCVLTFPISLIILIPLGFATIAFIDAFNSFQYVYMYCIKPYYVQNGIDDPFVPKELADDEMIFEDATK